MAKINKRLTIKGIIDYDNKVIIEEDRDLGEIHHDFKDVFVEFNELEGVTLTLSHDRTIEGVVE